MVWILFTPFWCLMQLLVTLTSLMFATAHTKLPLSDKHIYTHKQKQPFKHALRLSACNVSHVCCCCLQIYQAHWTHILLLAFILIFVRVAVSALPRMRVWCARIWCLTEAVRIIKKKHTNTVEKYMREIDREEEWGLRRGKKWNSMLTTNMGFGVIFLVSERWVDSILIFFVCVEPVK